MIDIKTLTYKQYFDCNTDDIEFIIKYDNNFSIPIDTFNVGDIMELPFGLVKDCQELFTKEFHIQELFNIILEYNILHIDNISDKPIIEIYQFVNYVKQEIEKINLTEREKLAGNQVTDEQIEAGIEDFDELGIYLQFNELTNGDVTKFEAVRKTKYSICLLELIHRKKVADYTKKINDIQLRKMKYKSTGY